jgi:hypothetical protein
MKCQNSGQNAPGCLEIADPEQTMDFSDIGEKLIYWCSVCGRYSHAIDRAIQRLAASPEGAETLDKFAAEVEAAELLNRN